MKKEPANRAAEILNSKKIIVIATSSADGQPWNTPVAGFRLPGEMTFYWTSSADSQHSKNIRANSKVFVVIFDEEPADGVYLLSEAQEITDEKEAITVAKVFGNDKYNSADGREYLGNSHRKIYKAVSKSAWINADKRDESGKFQYDFRKEIPLKELINNL